MQHVDTEKKMIRQIKEMVKNRFGKTFELNKLTNVLEADALNTPHIEGSVLHIPLMTKNQLLGTGVVFPVENLSQDEIGSLSDLVRTLLEPPLYNSYLFRLEENLEAQRELGANNGSSLPIFEIQEDNSVTKKKLLVLLGSNEESLFRFALHVHEHTHGWAFLKFQDVFSDLQYANQIQSLGNITIFVDKNVEMTAAQKKLIKDYIDFCETSPNPVEGPLFIFALLDFPKDIDVITKQWLVGHMLRLNSLPSNKGLQEDILEMLLY